MNKHGYRGATAVPKEILELLEAWAMASYSGVSMYWTSACMTSFVNSLFSRYS